MSRAIGVLIVVIAACAGCTNDTGKTEVACGASWDTTPAVAGTCDSACVEMMTGSGASCTTTIVYGSGGNYVCASTFDFEGVRGCCLDIGRLGQINGGTEPERQRRVFFLSCNQR